MASNAPYTLDDLQTRIHTLVENDSDTPESTDDEYTIRLNLINQSIGKWETEDTLWDELWTTYTHGSTVSTSTTYTLTFTDFRFAGGAVQLVLNGATTYVEVISPEQSQIQLDRRVVWFTGNNKDGWTLNLGWTPASGDGTYGATIKIPYYKYATRFTSASASTAKPEMSDPNYIVYDVAAAKSLMESRNNQFSIYNTEALIRLDKMKTINELGPHYQNGQVEDNDSIAYNSVMGE